MAGAPLQSKRASEPFSWPLKEIAADNYCANVNISPLWARVVSTSNQLEEEPWLPISSIITLFRIQVSCGDKKWDVLRRYSDFSSLHAILTKSFGMNVIPELPPKLLFNAHDNIAERQLELDTYLRTLLKLDGATCNGRILEFLGAEKESVRYGVRNFEYDSSQSEGNRYIRDNDL
eukprot:CAMPEP_0119324878 /NCGR_PEP_ID=MMETSP1333-20130426/64407_1 /TAXON_ID=418940 /ORGANISM="Scyphosphaera apsteinii, Strain RCC1455" /LENGTH=175 /DNA_ID=CAMNT_0007332693 /DNA_START=22 /DNA_END=549 /DNA_ORIENTATION=+